MALSLERNGHTEQFRPTGDNYEPEFRWAPVVAPVPTRRRGRVSGGAPAADAAAAAVEATVPTYKKKKAMIFL